MIADTIYEKCLPLLQNSALDDDDRTEKLEDLVRTEASLSGKELENAVLDALWRFRSGNSDDPTAARPPSRHTVIRRASPAPWQVARTPTPASPRPSNLTPNSSAIFRNRSSTASPFASPRASPRLAFVSPYIPHSPRLDAYQPNMNTSPTQELYGDLGNDSVEWLVGDDDRSNASSSFLTEALHNGASAELGHPQMVMDPHDMLRSIFGDELSNDSIQKSLEDNQYDIAATMSALMEAHNLNDTTIPISAAEFSRTVLVGKSMSPNARPVTPVGQSKSPVVCRYWLASGNCARADCRFSHDTTGTICKYWLQGNCLAGDTCAFSHDPTISVARLMQDGTATPPTQPNLTDYDSFPTLQPAAILTTNQISPEYALAFEQFHGSLPGSIPTSTLNPLASFTPSSASQPHSRTGSRHHSRAPTPSVPAVDDNDAFPTLGSVAKGQKKHHGKRGGHGHGHSHKESSSSSLADVVKMAPSPSPTPRRNQKPRVTGNERGLSAGALAIPIPQDLPWVTTGDAVNKSYVKARAEAFRHAGQRNKLLQGAAQAYNRQDARAAKALSLRGQAENNLMREAHRRAAQLLYEERNKDSGPTARELYVDLHGLHAEEAVAYLSKSLREHENVSPMRPIYAITGTAHHSRNGKDKIGKAVRAFLMEWRYAFREFTGPGDRNGMGGVVGIDPTSWDRLLSRDSSISQTPDATKGGSQSTKVLSLKKEDIPVEPAIESS
ncbi:hypothetical protein BT63DRAFT_15481 [Microthyrium microscopicum]|uniref:CCCH zinc finger and SMR domain-containing protein n=1 Tax=Microthyrium microscopicum TaxID=703497 RepID=A0A6A6US72_9PEZI|nr:hypothetical protein BT63DRAFT_15481 [Microthyrium microscopicum]